MGVDDLLEHGCLVCVVENHNGDAYANTGSNARNTMYSIPGFPTTTFDGWYGVVGGSTSSSIYYLLRPKYDQRIAEPSNCTVELAVDSTGPYDYHATITVTKVDNIPGANVRVHLVVTQSHIPQSWFGQTEVNFVNRKMVPDYNGSVIDFTSGNTQVVELDFSIAPNWPKENVEFVAFIQDMDAGQGNMPISGYVVKRYQIYQGTKVAAVGLTPDFSADPTVIAPNSYVVFSDLTTGGFLMTPETYHWYFPGATPDTSTMQSPTVQYTTCGKYDVKLVVNKGGEVDSITKTNYITVGPVITVSALPSNSECWYTPITLSAVAPNAVSYLWSPGGETTSSITVTAGEYGIGTHTFTVTVTDNNSCVNDKSMDVTFDACVGVPEKTNEPVLSVYPNPTTGTFTVEFNAPGGNYDLKVISPLNVTVYEMNNIPVNGKITKTISLKNAAKGIYYLILQDGSKKAVQKIFVD
jgi:PKD repeat protein